MPSSKPYFNTRLTPEAITFLERLKQHYGISQSAVMEILIRDRARELGLGSYTPAKTQAKTPKSKG